MKLRHNCNLQILGVWGADSKPIKCDFKANYPFYKNKHKTCTRQVFLSVSKRIHWFFRNKLTAELFLKMKLILNLPTGAHLLLKEILTPRFFIFLNFWIVS